MNRSHFLPTLLRCLKLATSIVLALCLGTTAIAQVDRAVLEGTVADPTGATISGGNSESAGGGYGDRAGTKDQFERSSMLLPGKWREPSISEVVPSLPWRTAQDMFTITWKIRVSF